MTATRARARLSPSELLIYASVNSREPMRLRPQQVVSLHLMLDAIGAERTGSKAWRVNRKAYERNVA